jgi:AcrR family transcriptional regulator
VATASLYNTFGSKEELVRAYLQSRHARTTQRLTARVEMDTDPKDRLLTVFDAHGDPSVAIGARAAAAALLDTALRSKGRS